MEQKSSSLHKNLTLLTQFHKCSPEFSKVFKKDMFLQTNRDGMLYTLNFLLKIFKPNVFKQDIIWPIYTKEQEASFRRAVLAFLLDYNSKHNLIKLPKIAASILSTAGGSKFIIFMLDLSTAAIVVTLRQRNKNGYDSVLDGFTSLDRQKQLSRYNKLTEDADQNKFVFDAEEQDLKNVVEGNEEELQTLKEKNVHLISSLAKTVDDTHCIKQMDKKSFADPEIKICVDKRLKELDIRENVARFKFERDSECEKKIHELATVVYKMVYFKTQDVKLDGSKYSEAALSAYISQLTSKGLFTPDSNMFVNGQITMGGLMKLCACSCKDMLAEAQEKFGQNGNHNFAEMAELYEWSLEEMNATKKQFLELEAEQREYLAKLESSIEKSNSILLDFEPNPRFAALLADSPQVNMNALNDLDGDEPVFASPMDSPYVQNYARSIIERLKASMNTKKPGEGSRNQTPKSTSDRPECSKTYLAKFDSLRRSMPGSPWRTKYDDFLDQSLEDSMMGKSFSSPLGPQTGATPPESSSISHSGADRDQTLIQSKPQDISGSIASPQSISPSEVDPQVSITPAAWTSKPLTSAATPLVFENIMAKYRNLKSKTK